MESTSTKATLTVKTGDQATEIFVIDSNFQRVANEVGSDASFELPRGLYTVKVRTGSDYQDQSIILSKNGSLEFPPQSFSSPTPLEGTSQTHEFHVGNSENYSTIVHSKVGTGGQLYVFVRDWTSSKQESSRVMPTSFLNPANGLLLCDKQGQVIIDFDNPLYPHDLGWDPWAACNVELDPGTYRLRLNKDNENMIEQTIAVSAGWQTQLFLLLKNYGTKNITRRADIANASIFMKRIGIGFKSSKVDSEQNIRLAELARQGLVNNRQILSSTIIQQLLDGKFTDPMLGIFGAHLLLLNKKSERTLLTTIVVNLRNMLGNNHPDVEALALNLKMGSTYLFDLPPMLLPSWMILINESVSQPELIPDTSLACQFIGQFFGGAPWLLWAISPENSLKHNSLLKQLKQAVRIELNSDDITDSSASLMDYIDPTFAVLSTSMITGVDETELNPLNKEISKAAILYNKSSMEHIVQMTGMPRGKVESMMNEI